MVVAVGGDAVKRLNANKEEEAYREEKTIEC
jgi:hypothetical protein